MGKGKTIKKSLNRQRAEITHRERRKQERKQGRDEKKQLKKIKKLKSLGKLSDDVDSNQASRALLKKSEKKLEVDHVKAVKRKLKFFPRMISTLEDKLTSSLVHEGETLFPPSKLPRDARPANQVYPEYYPEIYERRAELEKVEDLLEIWSGKLISNKKTFDYVGLHVKYGYRLKQHQSDKPKKSIEIFKKVLHELDSQSNLFKFLVGSQLLELAIDSGDLPTASKVLKEQDLDDDENENNLFRMFMLWDRFFVFFVQCFELEESHVGKDLVKQAFEAAINAELSLESIGIKLSGKSVLFALLNPENYLPSAEMVEVNEAEALSEAFEKLVEVEFSTLESCLDELKSFAFPEKAKENTDFASMKYYFYEYFTVRYLRSSTKYFVKKSTTGKNTLESRLSRTMAGLYIHRSISWFKDADSIFRYLDENNPAREIRPTDISN